MARSPRDPAPKDPGEGESPPPKARRRRTSRSSQVAGESETPQAPRSRRRTAGSTTPKAAVTAPGVSAEPEQSEAPVSAPREPVATSQEVAPESGSLTRRIASWVLTVLAAVAVTAAVIGLWVHETVLETDRFMAAVTPAVESEAVQAVVADRLSDEVIESLDLETRISGAISQASDGISDALADALGLTSAQVERLQRLDLGLQRLAAPIAAGVETRIRDAVDRFVASVGGNDLLLRLVETAHERTVLLLRDELEDLPNVVVDEGEVRLNLVPLMAEALRSVINAGVGVIGIDREIPEFSSSDDASEAIERLASVLGRDLPPQFGQVRLMSEDQLQDAQGLVRAFDRLVWILLVLAIVFAVLAVVLAPTPLRGLLRIGIAVAIGVVLGWIGVDLIASRLAAAASTAEGETAIAEVTKTVVATLQPMAAALAIIGVGTAAAALVSMRGWLDTSRGVDEGA